MPQWTAISKQQHATARYRPRNGYHHTREQLVAPVLLAELPKAVPHFVLGFLPRDEGFTAVALLGLEDGQNLYVHGDGRWLGSYVPASLRGHPFRLLPTEQGERILCIDGEQLTDDPDQGDPLFHDGQPTEAVTQQRDFHQKCEANRHQTQKAVNALQQAGVLSPWALSIPRGEDEAPKQINGLYRIDEKTLNNLDAETYATLRGAPMALAHAHLFSVEQTDQLTKRADYHAQQSRTPANLDEMFGEGDDDDLTFDFS